MRSQSKCKHTFDTQLKTALLGMLYGYQFFCPFNEFHVLFLQLGYTSSDDNGAKLAAIKAWAGDNMPASDADPQHADQVILVTGCVLY